MAYERNLVLVYTPYLQSIGDFHSIAADLAVRAPDIEVFVVNNNMRNPISRRRAGDRPTFVFSAIGLRAFVPVRGTIYAGANLSKLAELRLMREAGIRVPATAVIEPATVLDPGEWGPFVVVKPNGGMQGQGVRLERTRDVRWRDPASWPRDDVRFGREIMAQYFVDTGAHTTSYRVSVVLGRCIYSLVSRANGAREIELDPDGKESIDYPISSNGVERALTLNFDREIIEFGESVARAFPRVATLGVDVVREEKTGSLFALEVNSPGATWHLSSQYGLEVQRKHNLDFEKQFGALKIIADALIEVTRREAV